MTNVTEDLWPEEIGVPAVSLRTPVSILRQQAAYLGDKTQNIVKAEVSTSNLRGPLAWASPPAHDFVHTFRLVAPLLDNYKHDLFIVVHSMAFYPLIVRYEDEESEAETEAEFIQQLRLVLSSERTKEIIDQLIALSDK